MKEAKIQQCQPSPIILQWGVGVPSPPGSTVDHIGKSRLKPNPLENSLQVIYRLDNSSTMDQQFTFVFAAVSFLQSFNTSTKYAEFRRIS